MNRRKFLRTLGLTAAAPKAMVIAKARAAATVGSYSNLLPPVVHVGKLTFHTAYRDSTGGWVITISGADQWWLAK